MSGDKNPVTGYTGWISADSEDGFIPEPDRYHLYGCHGCPFVHRVMVVRALKGLENVITVTAAVWDSANGFTFTDKNPECTLDTVNGCSSVKEIYLKVNPDYAGEFSVPVLWDKKKGTIVSNDSVQIMRNLATEFNDLCPTPEQKQLDIYPDDLRKSIEEMNDWTHPKISTGVYDVGLAKVQEDYNKAVVSLFKDLDKAEEILSRQRYLVGDGKRLTTADVLLFATLVRFDWAYHTQFKCNKKMIVEYPNLWGFVREIYQMTGVPSTVYREHIMNVYYAGLKEINPTGIVAIGPDLDFTAPHNRDKISKLN